MTGMVAFDDTVARKIAFVAEKPRIGLVKGIPL